MDIFRTDGPVYGFMVRLLDMVVLNFCLILCSLPIVTMGAAITAGFHVTIQMVDERDGYIARAFFRAFRENIKQGSITGVIFLVAAYAVYLDSQLWQATDDAMFMLIFIVTAYIVTLAFLYTFALLSRYRNSIPETIRNSFRISMRYFGRTLVLILILAFELAVIFWNKTTIFFGLLIGPASLIYTISGTAIYIFRRIESEPGSVSNPEKLREEREERQ